MRVPLTARRSNQSILREINPEYWLEILMLKLKLQYFGYLLRTADSLEKSLMPGRQKRGQEEKRAHAFLRRQARWHSLLFKRRASNVFRNFPQFVVTHTVKGFSVVNEADYFWNSLALPMIQWMLAV